MKDYDLITKDVNSNFWRIKERKKEEVLPPVAPRDTERIGPDMAVLERLSRVPAHKKEKREEKLGEDFTFKPKINRRANSRILKKKEEKEGRHEPQRMVIESRNSERHKPRKAESGEVFERLSRPVQHHVLEVEPVPTFRPITNSAQNARILREREREMKLQKEEEALLQVALKMYAPKQEEERNEFLDDDFVRSIRGNDTGSLVGRYNLSDVRSKNKEIEENESYFERINTVQSRYLPENRVVDVTFNPHIGINAVQEQANSHHQQALEIKAQREQRKQEEEERKQKISEENANLRRTISSAKSKFREIPSRYQPRHEEGLELGLETGMRPNVMYNNFMVQPSNLSRVQILHVPRVLDPQEIQRQNAQRRIRIRNVQHKVDTWRKK